MRQKLIKKLANAIRAYRGVTDGFHMQDGKPTDKLKWKTPPDLNAIHRIHAALADLGLEDKKGVKIPYEQSIIAINGFKTFDQFNAWINEVCA